MLEEAQALKESGLDIVIGYFEPHARKDTIAKTEGLEFVSRRRLEYRGGTFEEMDTEAILKRAPAMCVVDEFAHTNVPGSERAKRWEDVMILLDAGIDVLTTMNLQHLESLNDQILQITHCGKLPTRSKSATKRHAVVIASSFTSRAIRQPPCSSAVEGVWRTTFAPNASQSTSPKPATCGVCLSSNERLLNAI
jgi:two-component system sensor histidine kinase KdpD